MTNPTRLPAIYLSHGGGPCFWMQYPQPIGPHGFDKLRDYLAGLLATLPARPAAILVVSGHWEESLPTLSVCPAPPMLFDYAGFPPHTYRLSYPAAGSPAIAEQARELLLAAGIESATDAVRGFDHGVFVPMMIIDPEAKIPVVMMSLQHDLDPARHIAIGQALAPLRDQGVLIIGSGNSYHNLREFFDGKPRSAAEFDQWLCRWVTDPDALVRNAKLTDWTHAPSARASHPREEHLLPLMVVAGAGGNEAGRKVFTDLIGQKPITCFAFGIGG